MVAYSNNYQKYTSWKYASDIGKIFLKITFQEVLQMNKTNHKNHCTDRLNRELRYALRRHHALSGLSQEELAFQMQISSRAFSALENGEYGFSVFSMLSLFSILPPDQRFRLFSRLCRLVLRMNREAA